MVTEDPPQSPGFRVEPMQKALLAVTSITWSR
jgi:hypothetical protein